MRNYDVSASSSAVDGKISRLISKITALENTAEWPRQRMEEWRRTRISEPADLENGQAAVTWETGKNDTDKLDIFFPDEKTADLLTLGKDLDDSLTALDFRHRLKVLKDPENTAVVIRIKKNAVLEKPVEIRFSYGTADRTYDTHLFVILEESAQAEIIERHEGQTGGVFVCGGTHLYAGPNAAVKRILLQDIGGTGTFVYNSYERLDRDASYTGFEGEFGGTTVKSRLTVDLAAEGAYAELNGIYLSGKNQHIDVKPVQRHSSPKCGSRSFYRGSVQDNGKSVFQGIIRVAEGAEETDAYLTNKNLILNDGARADSIPNLEILNNNVKCSHGSTTGRLDDDEIHYLETRGIDTAEAEHMLIEAFFENSVSKIGGGAEKHIRKSIAKFIKNWKS